MAAKTVLRKQKKTEETVEGRRQVIHEELCCEVHGAENPISIELAKELLGWTETTSSDYLFVDRNGKRIQCQNNIRNRPISTTNVLAYMQDILQGNWELNGETIIIGRTGITLNGQHSLIALVLAEQEYQKCPEEYPAWTESPPVLHKIVVYGILEVDRVINTLDTGRGRTLSDVLFRSEQFQKMRIGDRKKAAKIMEHAISMLWIRTGFNRRVSTEDSLRKTHSEAMLFLDNHPRLIEAVLKIVELDRQKKVSLLLSPGYAAGMLYLMSVSETPEDSGYRDSQEPNESYLDFSRWGDAVDFFAGIIDKTSIFKTVYEEFLWMFSQNGEQGVSLEERICLVSKAWGLFVTNSKMTREELRLKYRQDDDGFRVLDEAPILSGIDLGSKPE